MLGIKFYFDSHFLSLLVNAVSEFRGKSGGKTWQSTGPFFPLLLTRILALQASNIFFSVPKRPPKALLVSLLLVEALSPGLYSCSHPFASCPESANVLRTKVAAECHHLSFPKSWLPHHCLNAIPTDVLNFYLAFLVTLCGNISLLQATPSHSQKSTCTLSIFKLNLFFMNCRNC